VVVVATGFDKDQQDIALPQGIASLPKLQIEAEPRIPTLEPVQ
jgi:hypothetical protein